MGVEICHGVLRAPASLAAACDGVEAIISTATAVTSGGSGNSLSAVDAAGYRSLVEAAKRAAVRRFIYVSTSPKYGNSPLLEAKRANERLLHDSGLQYTVLQPSLFMEIWFGAAVGWDLAAGKAQLFGKGDQPISWISSNDVAAYAVAVLEEPKAFNQNIPLGGPAGVTPEDALRLIEKAFARPFKVTRLPTFMPKLGAAVLKVFSPKLASLMAFGTETLSGDVIDLTKARSIADVRFTPLEEWVGAQQKRLSGA
jgi:uncharacterized protein YbjT (DUF2867 family)